MMGALYFMSCIVVAYLLLHIAESLPGKPLPAICSPVISIAIGILFLTLVHCGVRAFQEEPTADAPYKHRATFGRYWDYIMASGSILIGVAFSLAVVTVFLITFLG
jgi:hypothetical protein